MTSPSDLGVFWTLRKGTSTVMCRVTTHARGMEIHIEIDGATVSRRVFKESAKLIEQSRVARESFQQDGWVE